MVLFYKLFLDYKKAHLKMSGKFVDRWFGSYWPAERTPKIAPQIRDE